MKQIDVEKVKKETFDERIDFEDNRDNLEEKYHVLILNIFIKNFYFKNKLGNYRRKY